ncbi:MAG: hypothetical protein GXX96_11955 [Planctomycetaceae bacterium]|mgnify:CR=1 FL=1|nr:hypothetical protein [Planctomycetaceae bacterium]
MTTGLQRARAVCLICLLTASWLRTPTSWADSPPSPWRIELAEQLEGLSGKPLLMTARVWCSSITNRQGPFLQPVDGLATPVAAFAPRNASTDGWRNRLSGEIGRNDRYRIAYKYSPLSAAELVRWREQLHLDPGRALDRSGEQVSFGALAEHTPYLILSFNTGSLLGDCDRWPSFVLTIFTDTGECFYHRFQKRTDDQPAIRLRCVLPTEQLEPIQRWLQDVAPHSVASGSPGRVGVKPTTGWLTWRTPETISMMKLPTERADGLMPLLGELDPQFWNDSDRLPAEVDPADWLTRDDDGKWIDTEEPKYLGRPVPGGTEYTYTFRGSEDPNKAWAELCLMRPAHPTRRPQFYLSDGRSDPSWRTEVIRPATAEYVRLTGNEYAIAVNLHEIQYSAITDPNDPDRKFRYHPMPPPARAQIYAPIDGRAKRIFNEPFYTITPTYLDRWYVSGRHSLCVLLRRRVYIERPLLTNYADLSNRQGPRLVEARVYDRKKQAFRRFLPTEPICFSPSHAAVEQYVTAVLASQR